MATTVYDPWDGTGTLMADTVHEQDWETHYRVLGPDGKRVPMPKQERVFGFDIRRVKG